MGQLFNFDYYKEGLKKIKCYYTYHGKINPDYNCWEGYILVENTDGLLDIKGFEKDGMDRDRLRYILGPRAVSYADKSLSFEIYPGWLSPIIYDLHYSVEDGCFYGRWFVSPSKKHYLPANENGEAIIRIEDVELTDKQTKGIMETIRSVGQIKETEYCDEIKAYEFMVMRQVSYYGESSSVRAREKLTGYSSLIKQ